MEDMLNMFANLGFTIAVALFLLVRKADKRISQPRGPNPKWFVLEVGLNLIKEVDENAG